MRILKSKITYLLLVIGLIFGSCSSEQAVKSTAELSREFSTKDFKIKDIYQNIQKGRIVASIYAVTTALTDYTQMESYALELSQNDEKYLIVYFLDEHENTSEVDMKGVLLNPDLRPYCKAVYEKTPGEESFTPFPFDS